MASELSEWLLKKNRASYSLTDQELPHSESLKDIAQIDLIIVLGGDGTYLEAVRRLNGLKKPILGINLGSLGFLTVTPADEMYSMVERTLNNELHIRPREMLEVQWEDQKATALNDITLERGGQIQLLNLSVYVDDHLVSHLKADGLIFSSPTGSTAYNLAAGGPILHPEVNAFAMTPICPHSLTDRPIIFPDDLSISVEITKSDQIATLTTDGQKKAELRGGQKVIIRKAACSHYVLRLKSHNYFDLLKEKLKFGQRA